MDRVDGTCNSFADGGVARPDIFVSHGIILDNDATAEEIAEAAAILEKTLKIAQRVLGREHPSTGYYRHALEIAREQIALRQGA